MTLNVAFLSWIRARNASRDHGDLVLSACVAAQRAHAPRKITGSPRASYSETNASRRRLESRESHSRTGTVSFSSHAGSSGRCAARCREYSASEKMRGGGLDASLRVSPLVSASRRLRAVPVRLAPRSAPEHERAAVPPQHLRFPQVLVARESAKHPAHQRQRRERLGPHAVVLVAAAQQAHQRRIRERGEGAEALEARASGRRCGLGRDQVAVPLGQNAEGVRPHRV